MQRCLACKGTFVSVDWTCPRCGFAPTASGGILRFIDGVADQEGGFEPEYFSELADVEPASFWFRSRNRLVLWALQEFFPGTRSFLEVGCGNGFVLAAVAEAHPETAVAGAELFGEGLAVAAGRLPGVPLYQCDIRDMPFRDAFDVVGSFDVLEHVREDDVALRELASVVVPGGGLIVTVPQHPWLWSAADDYARHERRYVRRELARKTVEAGFEVLHLTSFVSLLLPLLAASRLRRRKTEPTDGALAELRLPPIVDALLERVLSVELALTRRRVDWPAGGSLLLVARRKKDGVVGAVVGDSHSAACS